MEIRSSSFWDNMMDIQVTEMKDDKPEELLKLTLPLLLNGLI